MSNTRRIFNLIVGLVLCFIAGYILFSLGELAHIDLSYGELDARGKIELWVWRAVSVIVAALLFVWVVKRNKIVRR